MLFVTGSIAHGTAFTYTYDFGGVTDPGYTGGNSAPLASNWGGTNPDWTYNRNNSGNGWGANYQKNHGTTTGEANYTGASVIAPPAGTGYASIVNQNQSFDLSAVGDSITFNIMRMSSHVIDDRDSYSFTNLTNELTQIGFVDSASGILGDAATGDSLYLAALERSWDQDYFGPNQDIVNVRNVIATESGAASSTDLLYDLAMRQDNTAAIKTDSYGYGYQITLTNIDGSTLGFHTGVAEVVFDYTTGGATSAQQLAASYDEVPVGGLDLSTLYPALGLYLDPSIPSDTSSSGATYDGGDTWVTLAVPEPSSMLLSIIGGLFLITRRRR